MWKLVSTRWCFVGMLFRSVFVRKYLVQYQCALISVYVLFHDGVSDSVDIMTIFFEP